MTCRFLLQPTVFVASLLLALSPVLGPDAKAACTDPAGMEIDWRGCDLTGANLDYKILSGSNLANANLSGAGMEGVVLIRVDLTNTNLSGANLTYADLRDAVLTGADLTDANLTDAELTGATWTDGRVCADGSVGECK